MMLVFLVGGFLLVMGGVWCLFGGPLLFVFVLLSFCCLMYFVEGCLMICEYV